MSDLDKKEIKLMCEKIEMMKNTISDLKRERERLLNEAKTGKNEKKNIAWAEKLEGHIVFLEATYKDVEEKINEKVNSEIKKEDKLRQIRTAYFIAVVYESDFSGLRKDAFGTTDIVDYDKLPDATQESMLAAFTNLLFRGNSRQEETKPEKLVDILSDEEFKQMEADGDLDKLQKQKEELDEENDGVIKEILRFTADKIPESENKSIDDKVNFVIKSYMDTVNGFDHARKNVMADRARCQRDGAVFDGRVISRDRMEKLYAEKCEEDGIIPAPPGSPEDLWEFKDIIKEVEEISVISKKLQDKFLSGKEDITGPDGYNEELIAREKKLLIAATKYEYAMDKLLLEKVSSGALNDDVLKKDGFIYQYQSIKMLRNHVERQSLVDKCVYKNTVMNERLYNWSIYRDVSEKRKQLSRAERKELDLELAAWGKVGRIRREVASAHSKIMNAATSGVVYGVQNMLEVLTGNKPLGRAELAIIEDGLASLAIYRVLESELGKKLVSKYTDKMAANREGVGDFLGMIPDMKKEPTFKASVEKLFRKAKKSDFLEFLAKDLDKKLKIQPEVQKKLKK